MNNTNSNYNFSTGLVKYICTGTHMGDGSDYYWSHIDADLKEMLELAKADIADRCGILNDPCCFCSEVLIEYDDLSLEFIRDDMDSFSGRITLTASGDTKEYHIGNFMDFSIEKAIEQPLCSPYDDLIFGYNEEEIPF